MPRYVILEHDFPTRHWDFMLEDGELLRTWRLLEQPSPGRPIAAHASFEHRLVYLDYEGALSANRGTVSRWDYGQFVWVERTPTLVVVKLDGDRLNGNASLSNETNTSWKFELVEAGFSRPGP